MYHNVCDACDTRSAWLRQPGDGAFPHKRTGPVMGRDAEQAPMRVRANPSGFRKGAKQEANYG